MKIGDFLKKKRKMQHMTILQLSEKSGVSKSYISQIENNTSNGWESINKLMQALGLTIEDANSEGVNWWASDASSAASSDSEYIKKWIDQQDDNVVHSLRLFIESVDSRR